MVQALQAATKMWFKHSIQSIYHFNWNSKLIRLFVFSSWNKDQKLFFSSYIKSKQIFYFYFQIVSLNISIQSISQMIGFGLILAIYEIQLRNILRYNYKLKKKNRKYIQQTLEIHSLFYPFFADKIKQKSFFFLYIGGSDKVIWYGVHVVSLEKFELGIDKNSGNW